ncbi:alcohol dehydrogenase catalytic domain-containing protein, partial [Bordetella petrii]|uniref:alcohol dehydrogenase catalytic domain-containing protein n=1 Tax=Bordetella petrii TaxID=94624 RepID=UPI001E3B1B61
MNIPSFQAFRLHAPQAGDRPEGRFETLDIGDLSPGNVVIRVAYAGLNYKDALAAAGKGRIIRNYPRIGGIDLAGTVAASDDPAVPVGQEVVVHGFGIGVDCDGGYAQYARVPAEWVMPLPQGLGLRDACVLGAAGYTAGLALHWMEHNGLAPQQGPVLVTGATGGVGSIAVDMFSRCGYEVCAMSGKPDAQDYLRQLGAQLVVLVVVVLVAIVEVLVPRPAG